MKAGFAEAEVETLSGKPAEAGRDLNALQARARHDGYAVFELEARLLLGRAELRAGRPPPPALAWTASNPMLAARAFS